MEALTAPPKLKASSFSGWRCCTHSQTLPSLGFDCSQPHLRLSLGWKGSPQDSNTCLSTGFSLSEPYLACGRRAMRFFSLNKEMNDFLIPSYHRFLLALAGIGMVCKAWNIYDLPFLKKVCHLCLQLWSEHFGPHLTTDFLGWVHWIMYVFFFGSWWVFFFLFFFSWLIFFPPIFLGMRGGKFCPKASRHILTHGIYFW